MTTRYEYKSDCCEHDYVEQRDESQPQIITVCNDCRAGNYVLVSETFIPEIQIQNEEIVEEEVIQNLPPQE